MALTRLAIRRPLTVLMGILALVLMGGVAYTYLKVDRLPPISYPFVSVVTTYPQAAAEDVEQLITKPIEDAVSGVGGIDTISSTSSEGVSQVRIQFVQDADPNFTAIDVERRVSAIRNRLPLDAGVPSVRKADPNASPIMNIALTGAPLDQLYDLAVNNLAPELQSVLGVASVNVQGGLVREVQVRVDYARMAAYNVAVSQISTALTGANVSSTVGTTDQGAQQIDIRAVGAFENFLDSIRNLVVAQTAGGPVLLHDVADVSEGYKDVRQFQRLNGVDAVGLSIVKDSSSNALQVSDDIRDVLDKFQKTLPEGAQVLVRNDNSEFTRASLHAVQTDLVLAILLVALVILVFLHAWRNVVIILLSIPTVLISTLFFMYLMGFSLNIMTLMALALMIGILVDDSIVVIENVHRHLQLGEDPHEAAFKGRTEIGLAAMAITFADVVVYLPVAFMSGTVGQLFRQYGLTVVVATLLSLLVSFTLTPMLASRWLKHESEAKGPLAAFGVWWDHRFDKLAAWVEATVPKAVKFRWAVVAVALMLVGVSVALIQFRLIGQEYVPVDDDGNFSVNLNAPAGTTLAGIESSTQLMEAHLQDMPEVQSIFTSVSAAGSGLASGARSNIAVQMVPKQQRSRAVSELMTDVRDYGRQIPGVRVQASQSSPIGGGAGGNNVNVQLNGPDIDILQQVASQVQLAATGVNGLTPLQNNSNAGAPQQRIILDASRMSQLNVTSQQAVTALRTTLGGTVVSVLRPPGKPQLDITLIANDVDRKNLTNLSAIPVRGGATATGGTAAGAPVVTLGQISTVSSGTGPVQIDRVDRNRSITLNGTATGRPLGEVARDMQVVLDNMQLPPGYSYKLTGSVSQFNVALAALGQALILSVILEYMLLVALYGSWFYPLVVMLSVPLGLVGSLFALYATGGTINIFSMIGLIMGFGLVAKNGILLVDFTNTLRAAGVERTKALGQAARTRLRPILMTSATMVFGMTPLALKLEPGSESRAPMAVVVIGAICTSTVLAIIVVPAVYTLFDDLQGLLSRRRAEEPTPVHVRTPAPAAPHQLPHPVPAPQGVREGVATQSLDPGTSGGQRSRTMPGDVSPSPTMPFTDM